jgi:hypothetical protein
MTQSELDILNITQQVLRHLMLALAAANKSDLGIIGEVLESAATNTNLDPMACQMLADLAAGATGLHVAGIKKQ